MEEKYINIRKRVTLFLVLCLCVTARLNASSCETISFDLYLITEQNPLDTIEDFSKGCDINIFDCNSDFRFGLLSCFIRNDYSRIIYSQVSCDSDFKYLKNKRGVFGVCEYKGLLIFLSGDYNQQLFRPLEKKIVINHRSSSEVIFGYSIEIDQQKDEIFKPSMLLPKNSEILLRLHNEWPYSVYDSADRVQSGFKTLVIDRYKCIYQDFITQIKDILKDTKYPIDAKGIYYLTVKPYSDSVMNGVYIVITPIMHKKPFLYDHDLTRISPPYVWGCVEDGDTWFLLGGEPSEFFVYANDVNTREIEVKNNTRTPFSHLEQDCLYYIFSIGEKIRLKVLLYEC